MDEISTIFYNQSFTTRVEQNGLQLMTVGVKIEDGVAELVDSLASKEKRVKSLIQKKRYFTEYLNTLTPRDKMQLINEYLNANPSFDEVDLLAEEVYREIEEIEEAITFMSGLEPDIIPPRELDNQMLEDDFNYMIEALGV
ncbi:hypothetical protein ACTWQB_09420 [Piscibacillus sp. B03]|uniref:hypothetical protein n=1 Tax=Piscibacillus sp. B03 TaxID=3457430 RepID=UPI003FCDD074